MTDRSTDNDAVERGRIEPAGDTGSAGEAGGAGEPVELGYKPPPRAEERPICARCDSRQVYVRVTGTVVCRACGYRFEPGDTMATSGTGVGAEILPS